MRDEVFSSVCEQDTDAIGYQVSDLDEIEFQWEDPDLNMDATARLSIDTLFTLSSFNEYEMGSLAGNLILFDEEQNRWDFPPPTAAVSERSTRFLC